MISFTGMLLSTSLHHSIGRVPRIIRTGDHRYRLKWNILLEGYEVLTNYGVINWAKFPNGEAFKESDTREIFAYHYHVNIREKIQSSLDLADDQNGLTMEIRWLASRHQQFVEFAAAEMVRRYEMNILKQEERTFRSM